MKHPMSTTRCLKNAPAATAPLQVARQSVDPRASDDAQRCAGEDAHCKVKARRAEGAA
jgi:hypothetical protein